MGWPDDMDLPVQVLAAFGADLTTTPGTWTFTDLTNRLLLNQPIQLRAGRAENAAETSASSATLLLLNDDGALTPEQGMSEYWPNVAMNTPIWLRLRPDILDEPTIGDAFNRTVSAGWGNLDTGETWINSGSGGTVAASDFNVNGTKGTHSVPVALAYRTSRFQAGPADAEVQDTFTFSTTASGGTLESGVMLRVQDANTFYLFRAEIAASTQAVTASIYRNVLGPDTTVATGTIAGLTHAAGVPLTIKGSVVGNQLAVKVWKAADPEPAAWAVTGTDTGITEVGGSGIYTGVGTGNSNTKPVVCTHENFEVWPYWDLVTDHADEWAPLFLPDGEGGFTSVVRLTASGILRRLSQGSAPMASALRRKILVAGPVEYWSLESGRDVGVAQATLPGGSSLVPQGTVIPQFGDVDGLDGSDPLPDLTSHGTLSGPVRSYTHTGQWQVEYWFRTDTGDSLDFTASVPLQWDTPGGTVIAWDVLLFVGQGANAPGVGNIGLDIAGYSAPPLGGQPSEDDRLFDLALILDEIPCAQGSWNQLRVCARQANATTVELTAYLNDALLGTASDSTWTIGPITSVTVNPLQGAGAYAGVDGIGLSSVGHVAIYNNIVNPGTYVAGLGYPGETASDRILRLCAEEAIRVTVDPGVSEPMGPQRSRTLLEQFRECEAADYGVLRETRFGLGYRPRSTRTNQATGMTIALPTYLHSEGTQPDSILAPKWDDARIRNEWTISRTNGGEATAIDTVHQQRYGRYDDSDTLNISTDLRLPDHAGFRVHVGTHSGRRYPGVPLDLAGNPQLIRAWLTSSLGDRITRTHQTPQHPPEQIDTIIEGWSATLEPRGWNVTVNGPPYQPWEVSVAGGPKRYTAKGSTLGAGGLTLSGTSFLITSTAANGLWVVGTTGTRPTTFPLVVTVGAEDIMLSAISGTSSPQTATVASGGRGLNGIQRAWPAGVPVNVRDRAITPL